MSDVYAGFFHFHNAVVDYAGVMAEARFRHCAPQMCAGYETGAKNAFKHIDQCSRFEMPGKIGLQINQLCEFETRATTDLARGAGWGTNLSHRSGGTIDSFIADVTVATCAGKLKTGAPCRGEWVEKSNQLLRIEEEPGGRTVYAGRKASVR